jgi:hypothetical protein
MRFAAQKGKVYVARVLRSSASGWHFDRRRITLEVKQTGERSAGNLHAAFDPLLLVAPPNAARRRSPGAEQSWCTRFPSASPGFGLGTLLFMRETRRKIRFRCGGSIISSRFVLTAAYCTAPPHALRRRPASTTVPATRGLAENHLRIHHFQASADDAPPVVERRHRAPSR